MTIGASMGCKISGSGPCCNTDKQKRRAPQRNAPSFLFFPLFNLNRDLSEVCPHCLVPTAL